MDKTAGQNEKYGTSWTREELILCFYLYYQTPFSQTHKSNQEVVKLANFIGRTVGSMVRKLGNFGACDERLRAKNISGGTTIETKFCIFYFKIPLFLVRKRFYRLRR